MSALKVVTHYLGSKLSTSSQTLHYWKLIGETWFYWLAKCLCTSAEGQVYCLLARQRQEHVRISMQLSSFILDFKLWSVFRSWEKNLRKITLFLPILWFRGVCGKACRSPGWSKDWHGQGTLLLQTLAGCNHGVNARFGYGHKRGAQSLDASRSCVKFYFKRKLKRIQVNYSQRCLFCSTGWDRV